MFVYVYVYMDAGVCGNQQMLDPLELELWTMTWVMEAGFMSSGQVACTLNPWAISSPSSNFLILYVLRFCFLQWNQQYELLLIFLLMHRLLIFNFSL